ncbi:MAG TPA: hypothetical protein VIL63_10225 [Terriglobales bacterium]
MSATAGALKHAVAAATWIRERTQPKTSCVIAPKITGRGVPCGLVRQIFFPHPEIRRTHILFAGAGAETNIFDFCQKLGTTLAEMTGAVVAVVEAASEPEIGTGENLWNRNTAESWQACSMQVAERVWSVPSVFFGAGCSQAPDWKSADVKELNAIFDYVLFASRINDSETQPFSSMCDAAVLVLTANRTHKEIAVRAKEELLRHKVTLLGAVLDQRTFPIPEVIYRLL